jgi:hypothetical protein
MGFFIPHPVKSSTDCRIFIPLLEDREAEFTIFGEVIG